MRRQGAGRGLIATLCWISLLHLQTEDILLEILSGFLQLLHSIFPLLVSGVVSCTHGHSSSGSPKHSATWRYLKSS